MTTSPGDSVDRILADDESIEPSSGFAGAVMEAVRLEAQLPAMRFPWARVCVGVGVGAILCLAGVFELNTVDLSAIAGTSADRSMLVLVEAVVGMFTAGTCVIATRAVMSG
jgi:hypothetical protein